MTTTLTALCIGQPTPFRGEERSAIDKHAVEGPVAIRRLGLEGDAVADPKHHGGPEMAVHHYPHDHYPMWRDFLGGHDLLERGGAFGENIVAEGWPEETVHIGDRFRIGSAVLEVSSPRQPCWKIEHWFERKGMVKHILKTHACGWYYRVIEEGVAQAGEPIERVEAGHADWSVARVFACLYDPDHRTLPADLSEIAGLERLAPEWREKAERHSSG
ncbi:MAG: MOSC domain-containing protein, partial [Erythrobacter sp.]|nr:MOSC domain-containing protein [Erythrobacter sp.]